MAPTYLVTHSGGFHADELCSSAVLTSLYTDATLIRSRSPDWIGPAADRIVFDVGGEYDPSRHMYDHHQRGAPYREDGTPYSSFGLIWRHFGPEFARNLGVSDRLIDGVLKAVDLSFVTPIDLLDNGAIDPTVAGPLSELTLPTLLETLKPAFDDPDPEADNKAFFAALDITRSIVIAQVQQAEAKLRAEAQVMQAISHAGPDRVLELPMGMPFQSAVRQSGADHLLFVVNPRGKDWMIGGIRKFENGFELRADLPANWAGLTNDALQAASGVAGATFCHNGRFIAAATSRDAILEMADIAVKEALANNPNL